MKYQPITFEQQWQAVKFINEGGKLYQLDCCHAYEVDAQVAIGNYNATGPSQLYTIAKPAEWYEKLDGTTENGILCWVSDGSEHDKSPEVVLEFSNDEYITGHYFLGNATPLTSSEILTLLKNAPDYDDSKVSQLCRCLTTLCKLDEYEVSAKETWESAFKTARDLLGLEYDGECEND
jgi:hypothetical protein